MGVFNIANSLPQSVAPAIAPLVFLLAGTANYTALFVVAGVFCILGAVLAAPIRSCAGPDPADSEALVEEPQRPRRMIPWTSPPALRSRSAPGTGADRRRAARRAHRRAARRAPLARRRGGDRQRDPGDLLPDRPRVSRRAGTPRSWNGSGTRSASRPRHSGVDVVLGPGVEHQALRPRRPKLRVLQRGSAAVGRTRRRVGAGSAGGRCRRIREALRGQQPGDPADRAGDAQFLGQYGRVETISAAQLSRADRGSDLRTGTGRTPDKDREPGPHGLR